MKECTMSHGSIIVVIIKKKNKKKKKKYIGLAGQY